MVLISIIVYTKGLCILHKKTIDAIMITIYHSMIRESNALRGCAEIREEQKNQIKEVQFRKDRLS